MRRTIPATALLCLCLAPPTMADLVTLTWSGTIAGQELSTTGFGPQPPVYFSGPFTAELDYDTATPTVATLALSFDDPHHLEGTYGGRLGTSGGLLYFIDQLDDPRDSYFELVQLDQLPGGGGLLQVFARSYVYGMGWQEGIAAVPEPSGLALGAVGMACCAAWAVRRRAG